jgi:Uma2 family endonuclease
MAPIGDRHIEREMRLNRVLSLWALGTEDTELFVSVQNPLSLSEHWEPQPDLTVVRRSQGRLGAPVPEDVLLVVEVATTSLVHHQDRKLPLYAEACIPEAWIVDPNADVIEVHSQPRPAGYERSTRFRRGERMISANLPDLIFDAAEALPPPE